MPKSQKGVHHIMPKPYYVATIYYLPMQHAISLINQGYSQDQASKLTIDRFAYYGKHHSKRLKEFDRNQFNRHLTKFLNTPNAILVRKSPKHR